jgi:hypothetical protein
MFASCTVIHLQAVLPDGLCHFSLGVIIWEHLNPFPAGDLDNGYYRILDPLALAVGDGLDPAIRAGGHAPQGIDGVPRECAVKRSGYYHEIDIAPLARMARGVRAEEDAHASYNTVLCQIPEISLNDIHDCRISHVWRR